MTKGLQKQINNNFQNIKINRIPFLRINYFLKKDVDVKDWKECGSPEIRTQDQPVKSRMLYR